MDYDYEDVGDIPMIAPVRRVDAEAVDIDMDPMPPPPPSLPPPASLPASPEKEPPPPPPPPSDEYDDGGPPSLTPEPSPSRTAARFTARYDDGGDGGGDDDDRGMGGGPMPMRSSKFAGTGTFASGAGRLGGKTAAASTFVPSSPPPPPPPPPMDQDDSYYEDVGDIPMMSHRLPPPPPPPPDAVGGPALPAPGAAGAVLADVNDDTGVPVGPVAASPAGASLARRGGHGGRGDDDDDYDDEGDAGKGRKRHIPAGTVKGIGKRLFGKSKKDGEEEDADLFEVEESEKAGGGGEAAMDFNSILRPPLAPSMSQALASEPGIDVPPPPQSPPPPRRTLDDDMDMEGMSFMGEGSGGGAEEMGVPDDELLLRGADDLKRQSDAVFSPEAEENEGGVVNADADSDAGVDKSLMPTVVFNDLESQEGDSSLSHSAMMDNEPSKPKPKTKTEPPAPPSTKDAETKTANALLVPNEDAAKDEAVAASMTDPGDSTGDMMSDILGVTMPGDETTIEELEDTAAKLAAVAIEIDDAASPPPPAATDGATGPAAASPAANLDGGEQESSSEVVDSGQGVVGAEEGAVLEETKDSMAVEEDRFIDIPPVSPEQEQVLPHAEEPEGYDVAAKLAEAVYGQTADIAEDEIEVNSKEPHEGSIDKPVDRAAATGDDDVGPTSTEVPTEDDKPVDTLSTLRRADEALKAAGLLTGSSSNADAAADDKIPREEGKGEVSEVATATIATAAATAAAGGVVSSAVEAASSDGALDYSMNETPEVSMADADLEGVRLSAIDDQVSPIKKESRSGGDDSGASSNSALNLDITGPGGDGAWDTPEKTAQEKAEAAAVKASKTRSRAADADVEDPPAISLSLTDESLDDRRLETAATSDVQVKDEPVVARAKMQEPPGSPLSASKKKKPVWRAVVDEASGDIYYYNRKTRETTWDKPEGVEIDDKRRLFNESLITNSSAAASSVVDDGASGTLTKNSDVTHDDDSPQVGTPVQRRGEEQERELGENMEKVEKEDDDEEEKPKTGGKWKAVVDKSSGETYYYHTATNETTWTRPASYAEKKGVVKRGRKAAHSIGGLLGRSMKHVIGGSKGASHEEEGAEASTAHEDVADTNEADANDPLPRNDEAGRIAVVKDAETREAEAKKRGKALKFLKMKSVKHSTSETKGAVAAASIRTHDDDDEETPAKKKSLRLGFGKKKGGVESASEPVEQVGPATPSQAHEDVSSDAGMDGYSGMETSGEDDHGHGRGPDFSIAAMDTPDKVQLPMSAMKSRFQPSLRSPPEKDEINMSEDKSAAEAEAEVEEDGNDGTPQDTDAPSSNADNNGNGRKDDPNKLWRAIVDAKTLNTYYYNVRTKETSWEKPNGFIDVSREELSASLE